MAVVGELVVLVGGSTAPLAAALATARTEMAGFAASTSAQSGIIGGALRGVGTAAIAAGAGAALVGAASIKAAADFQEQMAIINTIARQTPAELNRTGQSILAIAQQTGIAIPDATKAFYDLLSAGVSVEDAFGVLRQSATLSIGALSTTTQAVDLLTTAINAYGLDAKGTAIATDQFALAVQNGKVTADQIAASFADIAPIARSAGIGIDEISASYAFLTAGGLKADVAMTQMQRAILELIKPSTALRDLQEKLGINFAQVASEKGLVEALQELRTAAEANDVPLTSIFGRVEGLNFVLGTTGDKFAGYNTQLQAMGSATGTAAAQMAERTGTAEFAFRRLGVSIQLALINIGTAFLPAVTGIVNAIIPVVNGIAAWAAANPQLASTLLTVAVAMGVVTATAVVLSAVIGAISLPVLAVTAAIAALALAWTNNWLNIRGVTASAVIFITTAWDIIMSVFRIAGTAIGTIVGGIVGTIQGLIGVVQTVAKAIADFFGWITGNTAQAKAELAGIVPAGAGPANIAHGQLVPGTPAIVPTNVRTTLGGVQEFQHGGVVPGMGAQLAIVHGGETITPGGGAGSVSIRHIHIEVAGREVAEYIDREMFGSASGFSSGFTAPNPVTGA